MILYSGTKRSFDSDVAENTIAYRVEKEFKNHGLSKESIGEFHSWENSLTRMKDLLDCPTFAEDIQVAIEYQIPQTSKRVDFLIGGCDDSGKENLVVVELKQWEDAEQTRSDGIVTTFLDGMVRAVVHPSYQAYSYAKTIENFNSTVQDEHISISPCAYLHNYKKSKKKELTAPIYEEIVKESPFYIKDEEDKLRSFISKYVSKASKRDLLFTVDNGKIRPSKALQDVLASMIKGNQEFLMIDEQKIIYEKIRNIVQDSQKDGKKYTVIVKGGPGTGKSVVAIQLLCSFIKESNLLASYVTKNRAPRNVYFEELKRGNEKLNYVKTLFKSSGSFVNLEEMKNKYDCLLVDEAHRLNEKSGFGAFICGENQIKEIINAAKVSVFFIDEDQVVTSKDIGSVEEIEHWADQMRSKIWGGTHDKKNMFVLTSQFRCNGSDGYMAFLDDVLGIRETANKDGFDNDYDLEIFDDPCAMSEALRAKNRIDNKARMLAGYCYAWKTKHSNDLAVYDIELEGGFRARWNFNNTATWAIDKNSFDQVGCIHTSQGLEFNYVGVIIGKDLRYENGKVITDPKQRANDDTSLRGLKSKKDGMSIADRIIRNTYRTLLTRAQKGCYIYCEDKPLQEYLKQRIKASRPS